MLKQKSRPPKFILYGQIIVGLVFATLLPKNTLAYQVPQTVLFSSNKVIISPSTPQDSRGETVYETQGDTQAAIPIVQGVFLPPVALKLPQPKYPKSLRRSRSSADVTVEGVVTPKGDFIDSKIVGQSDPEASANALAAVSKYRFQPATLDGTPVAVLARVVVAFRIQ